MNAIQRLVVRLWDAAFGEPPALHPVSRKELDAMTFDEIRGRQHELKNYLDAVESRVRRDPALEARNIRRGRK
jgi:hypothetical protein